MRIQASLKFLKLKRRQGCGFRVFGGDAVPDVLGKLDSLSNGQAKEVGSCLAHVASIERGWAGRQSVYYTRREQEVTVLLLCGDKASRSTDIVRARELAHGL